MPEEIDRQSIIDEEHLKLLSLGYMISAGVAAFICLFGLFYVFFGVVMSVALSHAQASAQTGQPPPAFIGWIFAGVGLVFLIVGREWHLPGFGLHGASSNGSRERSAWSSRRSAALNFPTARHWVFSRLSFWGANRWPGNSAPNRGRDRRGGMKMRAARCSATC